MKNVEPVPTQFEKALNNYQENAQPKLTKKQHQVCAATLGLIFSSDTRSGNKRLQTVSAYNKLKRQFYPNIRVENVAFYEWLYEDEGIIYNDIEKKIKHLEDIFLEFHKVLHESRSLPVYEMDSKALIETIRSISLQSFRYKSSIDMYTKIYQAAMNLDSRIQGNPLKNKGRYAAIKSWWAWQENAADTLVERVINEQIELTMVTPDKGCPNFIVGDRPILSFDENQKLLDPSMFLLAKAIFIPIKSDYYLRLADSSANFSTNDLNSAQFQQANQWVMAEKGQTIDNKMKSVPVRIESAITPNYPINGEDKNIPYFPHLEIIKNDAINVSEYSIIIDLYKESFGEEYYENLLFDLYSN